MNISIIFASALQFKELWNLSGVQKWLQLCHLWVISFLLLQFSSSHCRSSCNLLPKRYRKNLGPALWPLQLPPNKKYLSNSFNEKTLSNYKLCKYCESQYKNPFLFIIHWPKKRYVLSRPQKSCPLRLFSMCHVFTVFGWFPEVSKRKYYFSLKTYKYFLSSHLYFDIKTFLPFLRNSQFKIWTIEILKIKSKCSPGPVVMYRDFQMHLQWSSGKFMLYSSLFLHWISQNIKAEKLFCDLRTTSSHDSVSCFYCFSWRQFKESERCFLATWQKLNDCKMKWKLSSVLKIVCAAICWRCVIVMIYGAQTGFHSIFWGQKFELSRFISSGLKLMLRHSHRYNEADMCMLTMVC